MNYNQKFRNFFKNFQETYEKFDDEESRKLIFDSAIEFVEANRDFVMQYPLIESWNEIVNWEQTGPGQNIDLKQAMKELQLDKDKQKNIFQTLYAPYSGKDINLYFHIPFCHTRCTYCNFHIVVGDKKRDIFIDKYLQKVEKEVDNFLKYSSDFNVKSIFIGGGTTSYLSNEHLQKLFELINSRFANKYSQELEFTFEGNPESFDQPKIDTLKAGGINRVSLGVQTFNNDIIKRINRLYDDKKVFEVIELLKLNGFDNINIDMIYGLPGHNYDIMKADLQIAKKLNIKHITYYPLYYYEDAILSKTGNDENNLGLIYGFYDEVVSELEGEGFKQYGREYLSKGTAIHNYQNNFVGNENLIGFGHSAYSFNGDFAFLNNQDLVEYMKNDFNIDIFYKYNNESFDRRMLVLGTRNIEIKKSKLKDFDRIKSEFSLPVKLGLVEIDGDKIKLTYKGLKYQELLAHMFV